MLKKVHGIIYLTLPKKRFMEDVDTQLVLLMIKSTFSEDVLCLTEKGKSVNVLPKFWFMIQLIKLSINLEPKVFLFNLEKITVLPFLVNLCSFMEVNLKTVH